ncbi:Uncharacterised protein [Mycobacteroides abscessus subsp. abscessus]|nr:Uncharacterised protein [Mycobacteroides abscessus subsp. abscessus]
MSGCERKFSLNTMSRSDPGSASPSAKRGLAPRNPKIDWSVSAAMIVDSVPVPTSRTSSAACGSRCCASSTIRCRMRLRCPARSSGSVANADSADPTSSAASTAGADAPGVASPTAPRNSMFCSYCAYARAAAIHSGRRCARPSDASSSGPTPRSAARIMRSRSACAKPSVPSAGRSNLGQ